MSELHVAKFGGTSVANFDAMQLSAQIIQHNSAVKLVVSSACSGITNLLVELAGGIADARQRQQLLQQINAIHQAILDKLNSAETINAEIQALHDEIVNAAEAAVLQSSKALTDRLVACGELISTHLLAQLLREQGIAAVRFDVREVMCTDNYYGKAEPQLGAINEQVQQKLLPLCQQHVVVTQGFIGADEDGNTTTLGRGGSDYSAAILAEALNADRLEIWTDVPGIYTTDPRIAPKATSIKEISFSEASEMANFGAKILHPSTLVPALRKNIPVFVGSSKAPEQGGTWIRQQVDQAPEFRALALRCNQTLITLRSANMFHAYGFLAKVFEILAKYKVSVDLITTSEISVSLTLDKTDTAAGAPELPAAARKELEALCSVEIEQNLCLVALIGNHMDNKGYAKKVFGVLDEFNIRLICYGASHHNLCFLVGEHESKQVIQTLHLELFETQSA